MTLRYVDEFVTAQQDVREVGPTIRLDEGEGFCNFRDRRPSCEKQLIGQLHPFLVVSPLTLKTFREKLSLLQNECAVQEEQGLGADGRSISFIDGLLGIGSIEEGRKVLALKTSCCHVQRTAFAR